MSRARRDREGGRHVTFPTFRHHIESLSQWSQGHQVPDPVHYNDLVVGADEIAGIWLRSLPEHDPALAFRYPKKSGSQRILTLVTPRENTWLRAACTGVLETARTRMPTTVFSAALLTLPPFWRFKSHPYQKFVRSAKQAIREWACVGMYRTDVENYYPSVNLDLLLNVFMESTVAAREATFLIDTFRRWNLETCSSGIPIGPEASGVCGTFFLHPVDSALLATTRHHCRYMDDVVNLHGRELGSHAWFEVIDGALASLALRRSVSKTHHAATPEEARHLIERADLASVEAYSRGIPDIGPGTVREYYETHIAHSSDIDVTALRACVRAFRSRLDRYPIDSFIDNPAIIDADPQVIGRYLVALPRDRELGDACIDLIGRHDLEASRLHLIRAARHHSVSKTRANRALAAAADGAELQPVRVWALAASAAGNADPADLVDIARADGGLAMRRGAIVALRPAASRPARLAVDALAGADPQLLVSARWSATAA
jgi:hypothetical protein